MSTGLFELELGQDAMGAAEGHRLPAKEIENILLGPSHPGRAASLWSVGKGGLYCLQPLNCFSGGSGSVVAFKPLQSFDFICLFFFVLLYSVIHAASMGSHCWESEQLNV